jgi:hypothetical protein
MGWATFWAIFLHIIIWYLYFQTKNPNLGKFLSALKSKIMVGFMAFRNI